MCGGIREMQSRRTPRLLHEEMKPNTPRAVDKPLVSCCCAPRRRQPAPAGLAIVAALEAELLQSGGATSVTKAAESPPSSTSSLPIPISSSSSSISSSAYYYEEMHKANLFHKMDNFPQENCNKKGDHTTNDGNVENQNRGAQKSIFSTSLSPPCSAYINYVMMREDFLGVCFSCKRPLPPGKDIFMYRGDRGFCSTECRHKHIVAEEGLLCSNQGKQQYCVQASPPNSQPKYTSSVVIAILV